MLKFQESNSSPASQDSIAKATKISVAPYIKIGADSTLLSIFSQASRIDLEKSSS